MRPAAARRLGATLPLALAAASAGCAGLLGRAPMEREVRIDLPVSRDAAVRRTLAAFRAQGYTVRETLTSGTAPESEPFSHRGEADAVFRAQVTGSRGESRVVLTGEWRNRELGGLVRGPYRELKSGEDGVAGELWARLVNLGLVIRRP
ncbi:hypothetical protein [Roseisolibacter sp. H3M3-2]|uniref:hypothetical protein n=1 Tax=Roseisolibacter sp. H3M3-2 TaxID=3031323 RepID=UPI0023D9EEA8|nr:hypothetical protein [Roseisolibacter sp. H3M3-2]MDF1504258.1 hypothetical protein [Roseisolibacter sp. H3M3-2]